MGESDTPSIPMMEDFNKYVDDTITALKIQLDTPDISLNELVGSSLGELESFSSDECLTRSIKVNGYSMFLRGQINECQAKLNWCEDALNKVFSDEWANYDPFLKAEIKKQSIIKDNSFASSVEKLRVLLKAKITLLDDKIKDLRDIAQTLHELGRKRGYNERN